MALAEQVNSVSSPMLQENAWALELQEDQGK